VTRVSAYLSIEQIGMTFIRGKATSAVTRWITNADLLKAAEV